MAGMHVRGWCWLLVHRCSEVGAPCSRDNGCSRVLARPQDRVLIEVVEAADKTSGGLLLTEGSKDKPTMGKVRVTQPEDVEVELRWQGSHGGAFDMAVGGPLSSRAAWTECRRAGLPQHCHR